MGVWAILRNQFSKLKLQKLFTYPCAFFISALIFLFGEKNYLYRYQQLPKTNHHPDKGINPVWKHKFRSTTGCLFQDLREFKFNTNVNMRRVLCVLLASTSSCFGLEQHCNERRSGVFRSCPFTRIHLSLNIRDMGKNLA